MFLIVRLFRPLINRAPARVLAVVAAVLGVGAIVVGATGIEEHERAVTRIAIGLLVVTVVLVRAAVRSRRAHSSS